MENITSKTNSNLINAVRGIKSYTREKPRRLRRLAQEGRLHPQLARPDIFGVMEGQARPPEEPDQGEETAPLLTPGPLCTPGKTLLQRQATKDGANQKLYAILYLVTDKAAALLVAIHA